MNFPPPTEKQARTLWFTLTGLAAATVIALIVALIWGLGHLLKLLNPILWPLAAAAIVACLLSPVVDWLERRNVPRIRAVVLVFIMALALLAGVLASVIPQVVVETQQLFSNIPRYSAHLQQRVSEIMAQPPEFLRHFLHQQSNENNPGASSNQENLSSTTNWLAESLPKMGSWLYSQIGKILSGFGVLAGLVLVPVYAFYFLLEKRGIENHWKDYLPVQDPHVKAETIFVINAIQRYLVAFFRGQVLVAICDSVLYTIGFLCLGLNYAFLLGFAAALILMVPFLGAIILCLTTLMLTLVQYADWLHPVLVLGLFAVVQTLESLFISPKIIGDRVGLHPVVIIIAVMTGTTLLGGLLGGILAIPLAAALRVILARYVWKKRETA